MRSEHAPPAPRPLGARPPTAAEGRRARPRAVAPARPLWRRSPVAALAAAATCAGCYTGSMRVVRLTPASGELALSGEPADARARAESYLNRQCPAGYVITDEAAAPAWGPAGGERAEAPTSPDEPRPDAGERRLRFQCKGSRGAIAPPPPPPLPTTPPTAPEPLAPEPLAPEAPAEAPPRAPPVAPASPPSSWF